MNRVFFIVITTTFLCLSEVPSIAAPPMELAANWEHQDLPTVAITTGGGSPLSIDSDFSSPSAIRDETTKDSLKSVMCKLFAKLNLATGNCTFGDR